MGSPSTTLSEDSDRGNIKKWCGAAIALWSTDKLGFSPLTRARPEASLRVPMGG